MSEAENGKEGLASIARSETCAYLESSADAVHGPLRFSRRVALRQYAAGHLPDCADGQRPDRGSQGRPKRACIQRYNQRHEKLEADSEQVEKLS